MVATQSALSSISPFFIVRDLKETTAFYRDRLGFEITFSAPDPKPFFAIIRRDGAQLFIKEIGEEIEPLPNRLRHEWARWDAYVFTPDPDELASELNANFGYERAVAADNEDGLRGFEVVDPNGYVFFFGRPRCSADTSPE